MKRKLLLLVIITAAVSMAACSTKDTEQRKNKEGLTEDTKGDGTTGEKETAGSISLWTVYWDSDITAELARMEKYVGTLCYFAAYFKEDGSLFIPPETKEVRSLVKMTYGDKRFKSYLTVVNDITMEDGTSKLKDTELLTRLLESEDSRKEHIKDLLSMTLEGGYDGLEIDYEAIRKDMALWKHFTEFVEELYRQALSQGLGVRILLEPGAPTEKLSLPEGPEYVLMCYNLFGYGTEPGPKADRAFLEDMVEKMKGFQKVNFALATGGFDFGEEGSAAQVTEEDALLLIKDYNAVTQRDEQSQCVVFQYRSASGKHHEVWYADKNTIEYWIQIIEDKGDYSISLWRLGGNVTVNP